MNSEWKAAPPFRELIDYGPFSRPEHWVGSLSSPDLLGPRNWTQSPHRQTCWATREGWEMYTFVFYSWDARGMVDSQLRDGTPLAPAGVCHNHWLPGRCPYCHCVVSCCFLRAQLSKNWVVFHGKKWIATWKQSKASPTCYFSTPAWEVSPCSSSPSFCGYEIPIITPGLGQQGVTSNTCCIWEYFTSSCLSWCLVQSSETKS